MMRRGSTLIEMAMAITIAGLLAAAAGDGMARLQRLAASDAGGGERCERACLRLRRDLAAGRAAVVGDALHVARDGAAPVVWRLADGQVERDGVMQMAASAFTLAETADGLVVTIAPPGLPARRIEAAP